MKRKALFLVILGTFYLAAMYRYPLLLALCAVELLLLPVSFALALRFCRLLSAQFEKESVPAQAEKETLCSLRVDYRGHLPVGRYALKLRAAYPLQSKKRKFTLYGSAQAGQTLQDFKITAPYCGLLQIRLRCIKAYDPFALFSVRKRQTAALQLAVFPKEEALRLARSGLAPEEAGASEEQSVLQAGSAQEVRQLREYRAGDPVRCIHWKLSAKSDTLWRKEFERETEAEAQLYLDLTAQKRVDAAQMSCFYTLTSALVMGLLQSTTAVLVSWYDDGLTRCAVGDAEQCRTMLFRLYQSALLKSQPSVDTLAAFGTDGFRLTTALVLCRGEQQLYQFSVKAFSKELSESVFFI